MATNHAATDDVIPYPPDAYQVTAFGVFMWRDLDGVPTDHLWICATRLRKELYNCAVQQLTTARALTDAVQTHHGDISQLASEAEAHAAWVEWATDLMDDILTALAARNALPPSRASHQ